ncbi:hypothetical protein POTOM_028298 [Populus tomentosa]|uniref:Uncharacterized protein n=1 Tax=Populus tomentosa TaxID=118781 RepID=A0A8X8CVM7_POPTO|nr:hypothetical protein POTOM_028298 [Populus tomentosa]
MTALSTSLLSITTPQAHFLSAGTSLKPKDQCLICVRPGNLSSKGKPTTHKKSLTIQARYGVVVICWTLHHLL